MRKTLMILGALFVLYLAWNFISSQNEIKKKINEYPKEAIEEMDEPIPAQNAPIIQNNKNVGSKELSDGYTIEYKMDPDFLTGTWRGVSDDYEITLAVYVEDGYYSGNYCAIKNSNGVVDCRGSEYDDCGMMGSFNDLLIEIDYSSCLTDHKGKGMISRKGENMIWKRATQAGELGKDHHYLERLTFIKVSDDPFQ